MKALIAAALLLTTPAFAAPSYNWGGSSATLVMGPGVPVATVICHNEMTGGQGGQGEDFTLSVGAFEVQVSVWQEWGDVPDRYTVTPPEGYVAVPQFIDVDENGTAEIQIYSMEGFGA